MVSLQAARLLYYLPTYNHHLHSSEALCLDDDESVVMVKMMELAAVPPFFSRGHETPVNAYFLVFSSRSLYT